MEALGPGDVTKISIGIILALIVLGALLCVLVTHVVGRLVVIALVVGAGILVWVQRAHVKDEVNSRTCNLTATFFGVHVDVTNHVKQVCARD